MLAACDRSRSPPVEEDREETARAVALRSCELCRVLSLGNEEVRLREGRCDGEGGSEGLHIGRIPPF